MNESPLLCETTIKVPPPHVVIYLECMLGAEIINMVPNVVVVAANDGSP